MRPTKSTHRLLASLLGWLTAALCAQAQPVCDITRYDENTGMSQWHVTQMLQDSRGLIWFSTWNGLDRFDGYEFTNFKSHAGDGCVMPSDRIRDLRMGKDGGIYCKAEDEWFLFDQRSGTFLKAPDADRPWLQSARTGRQTIGGADREIVFTDRYGTQWRIDRSGRLACREGAAYRDYPATEAFPDIQFHMADRQGNLWLLTRQGVYRLSFRRRPASPFPLEHPAQPGAFLCDSRQRLWLTTKEDRGVRIYDRDSRLLGYLTPEGRLSKVYSSFGSPVYCLHESADGTVWMGSKPDGLFRLRPKADGSFQVDRIEGLRRQAVYSIQEDARGRLWVGAMGDGVSCVVDAKADNPSRIVHFIDMKGWPRMRENQVRHLLVTPRQQLLAATTEGLLIGTIPDGDVRTMSFRLHTKEAGRESSLSCNATMDVLEMPGGRFFVSTESGGVNEILTRDLSAPRLEFRHYHQRNGLNSDVALSLSQLDAHHLMIVSSNQLMTLDLRSHEFSYYDVHFFHEPYRFAEVRPLRLPDGRWLFGLAGGAVTMTDRQMRKSREVPPVILTAISVAGREPMMTVDHLQTLTLRPGERSVSIYFAALDYSDPSRVRYAFKMAGDEDWNYVGNNRMASFADMSPGTYELLIRATNADGVWGESVRRLTIVVEPKFLESLTGRLLMLFLLLGVVAVAVYTYLYIQRMKRQQRETLEAYLALVERAGQKEAQPVKAQSEEDAAFMQRVMAFVEEHIGDADATIVDMAEATATSRSGLNRKMKSIIGVTPADFLREARIKRACQLLRTTDAPVADIAYRCGFTDPKYFSKSFKLSQGVTPSEYRQ